MMIAKVTSQWPAIVEFNVFEVIGHDRKYKETAAGGEEDGDDKCNAFVLEKLFKNVHSVSAHMLQLLQFLTHHDTNQLPVFPIPEFCRNRSADDYQDDGE